MRSIIRREPGKEHGVFDMEAYAEIFAAEGNPPEVYFVTSPFHLYSVEAARDRFAVRGCPSRPVDVFTWSKGEAEKPFLTKIGGVPYLPKDCQWPTEPSGKPYIFLGQLCFLDSRDVLPVEVPGDVLLFFVKAEYYDPHCHSDLMCVNEPDELRFQWVKVSDTPCWSREEITANEWPSVVPTFSGVIHRSEDYTFTEELNQTIVPISVTERFYAWQVEQFDGVKIGGRPYFHGGHEGFDPEKLTWQGGTYIARLGVINIALDAAYPWCNTPAPIPSKTEAGKFTDVPWLPENTLQINDMGDIVFFMKPGGEIVWIVSSG